MSPISDYIHLAEDVASALENRQPTLALESTVITHGLPYPSNMYIAKEMEAAARKIGVIPATIAVLDGKIQIGLDNRQLERLTEGRGLHKISRRDYGPALAFGWSGGTTVSGTMLAAHAVGITVFATGGIGGVHRQPAYDVSADLTELAGTPMIVICAGVKAILDIAATLEYLETASVPVVGYQTDEFPAFYSRESGFPVSARADTPDQVVALAQAHWATGSESAILVTYPVSESRSLAFADVERAVKIAIQEAENIGMRGQTITPFLLNRVGDLTGGDSVHANMELLKRNAQLGAEISQLWALSKPTSKNVG